MHTRPGQIPILINLANHWSLQNHQDKNYTSKFNENNSWRSFMKQLALSNFSFCNLIRRVFMLRAGRTASSLTSVRRMLTAQQFVRASRCLAVINSSANFPVGESMINFKTFSWTIMVYFSRRVSTANSTFETSKSNVVLWLSTLLLEYLCNNQRNQYQKQML